MTFTLICLFFYSFCCVPFGKLWEKMEKMGHICLGVGLGEYSTGGCGRVIGVYGLKADGSRSKL